MKKITYLLTVLTLVAFCWQSNAQCPTPATPDYVYCYDSNETDNVFAEAAPSTPGGIATVVVTQGTFENNFDSLTIYEGAMGSGTSGTIVFGPSDGDVSGTYTATVAGNYLIFVSNSDGSVSCQTSQTEFQAFDDAAPTVPPADYTYCYDNGETDVIMFEIPGSAGDLINAQICSGSWETNWDDLTVYQGATGSGTSGTIVFGPSDGDLSGTTISSTVAGEVLTFVSNSDGSNSCVSGGQSTAEFNFEYVVVPTCAAPSTITSSNVMGVSADVTWTDGIGIVTANTVTVTPTITGSPFTINAGVETISLTGLTPSTAYTVEVTNDCAGTPSDTVAFTTTATAPANDTIATPTPITPSAAGTGCGTFTFADSLAGDGTTDSGLNGSCNATNTGLDRFYSWTATSDALIWNDGAGGPGIVIRDDLGVEIVCEGTFAAADTQLSGWTIGDDLIIQVYDFGTADVDTTFCLEEFTLPPPPANDDCANATALTVGSVFADNALVTTNVASTASGETPDPTCGIFGFDVATGEDVWYSVTVPASGSVTIETQTNAGSTLLDTTVQVYSGACGSLVLVECDDDDGVGAFSLLTICGRTPGEVLLVRAWEYGTNTFDTFQISAYEGATTWDGTAWSGNAPTTEVAAIIDGAYTTAANGDIDACTLTVTASGDLTVSAAGYANVANGIVNEGTITVENTGSVVQVDDAATVTGAGTFTTNVITTAFDDADDFTYFSSPSANGTPFSWSSEIWSFNETTQRWVFGGTVGAAQGVAVRSSAASAGENNEFDGAFNNGVFTAPLEFNASGVPVPESTIDPDDNDSTLTGNPYPSGIDLYGANGLFGSGLNTGLDNIQMWTHNATIIVGGYEWSTNSYVVCNATSCTDASTVVSTGQGFFAVGNGVDPTLTFNNAMRVTTGNTTFKSANVVNGDKIWLNLSNATVGYNNNVVIAFSDNGSENYDLNYDSRIADSNSFGLNFFIVNDTETNLNNKLVIDDRGVFTDEKTVPVGFRLRDQNITELTLSINNIEGLDDVNVYAIDHLTNVTHDLKITDYTFNTTNTGDINDRFDIVFTKTALAVGNNITTNNTLVVSNQSETEIKVNMLDGNTITNFKAYDVLGKLVIDMAPNASNFVINTNLNQGQVLFIKATLENGQVLDNKFIKL